MNSVDNFIFSDASKLSEVELTRLIEYHNRCYWGKGEQNISDDQYDELLRALEKINPVHPLLQNVSNHPIIAGSWKLTSAETISALCPCCGHSFKVTTEPDIMQQSYVYYSPNPIQNITLTQNINITQCQELSGKKVCFTGFLEYDKQRLKDIAVKLGMIYRTEVSKHLNFLVCGSNPGPQKLIQAKEFNITTINIDEFIEKYLN